ncbi:MAG TPA: hypothetical protein VLH75_20425 [Longimicrobiales bacterium]|nr:hypothetical protein [Longimicrobiales bacterium]
MRSGDRRGVVLAMAVIALVALGLLAHGALLLARRELAASLAGVRLLQARAGAEAGYREAMAVAGPGVLAHLPRGGESLLAQGTLGGHAFAGLALRLSREAWRISGEGHARGVEWSVGVGAAAWILDAVGRLEAREAVVELAGGGEATLLGRASGFTVPEEFPLPDDLCGPWEAVLDTLRALRFLPVTAGVEPHADGEPSLGPLGPRDLGLALAPLGWAEGSPRPAVSDGVCDASGPANLGDPGGERFPCGAHLPARFREGDVTMVGGTGQGLLVVTGDAVLSGTLYEGLVLVGGSLILRDGARLLGAARVGNDILVDPASALLGSACRALRALEAAAEVLARPVLLSGPVPLTPGAR